MAIRRRKKAFRRSPRKRFLKAKDLLAQRSQIPIGSEGVVIGTNEPGTLNSEEKRVFYYVVSKDGKYYYHDPDATDPELALRELPRVPRAGTGVLKALTERGSLLADIDQEDTGGDGGYCFLLSVSNLKTIGGGG